MIKLFLISLLYVLIPSVSVKCAEPTAAIDYKHKDILFFLSVGYPLAVESEDFYDQYSDVFVPIKGKFRLTGIVSCGMRVQFFEKCRLGIVADYSSASLNDSYSESFKVLDLKYKRDYRNTFRVTTIPVFVTAEYVPLNKQFRSYTGLGVGVLFSEIVWNQQIISDYDMESRFGGEHHNESYMFPALRVYTGFELGFDQSKRYSYLGSFTMELSYSYMFREKALFSAIKNQYINPPESIDKTSTILPGYIGLNIGVTINME